MTLAGNGTLSYKIAPDEPACCQECYDWGWYFASVEEHWCNEASNYQNWEACYYEGLVTGANYYNGCILECPSFGVYCGYFMN